MRLENSIKNAKASFLAQIVSLFLGFFNRFIFIKYLGSDYLGFSGLFSSILSMLSLAELGLGSAFIYIMYKPMHDGDNKKLASLCVFYRKVYIGIAVVVLVLGSMFIPLIQIFIKDIDKIPFTIEYIRKIYILSLSEIVVSYLFVYKTSILSVGQQSYLLTNVRTAFSLVITVLRTILICLTHNYVLYLLVGIVSNILSNVYASRLSVRRFPEVFEKNKKVAEIEKEDKDKIIKNAVDLSVHNISGFVVNSTDNLIISSFVGIEAVGLLSNYLLIQTTVRQFIASIAEAVQAPLGDLVTDGDKEKSSVVVCRMLYIFFVIGAFCSISMCSLSDDFIEMLFGKEYLISFDVLLICSINLFVWTITRPVWKLSMVTGLFKKDKINAVVEAVVNAIISLVAVQFWGVFGTFVGTTCSYIVAYILKVRLQFRYFLEKSPIKFWLRNIEYCIIYLAEMFSTLLLSDLVNSIFSYTIIRLMLKGCICIIIPNAFNLLLYRNSDEGKYLNYIIKEKVFSLNRSH